MQNPRRSRQPPTAINHGTMNRGSTGIQTKECSSESSRKLWRSRSVPRYTLHIRSSEKKTHGSNTVSKGMKGNHATAENKASRITRYRKHTLNIAISIQPNDRNRIRTSRGATRPAVAKTTTGLPLCWVWFGLVVRWGQHFDMAEKVVSYIYRSPTLTPCTASRFIISLTEHMIIR